ncbi:MAG: hypothetical protein E7480_06130 [Ruminococcaceae bacterium]|nr:hypothetical protein [Oscillospiraceae bacterium]
MKNMYNLKTVNENAKNPKEFIAEYEKKYDSTLKSFAVKTIEEKKKIILLTGPSGSGKTTTALKLKDDFAALGHSCVLISLDNFFKNKTEMPKDPMGKYEFEKLEALEIPLINQKLYELASGKKTKLPYFDFNEGRRIDDATEMELGNSIAIIEGIHAHNESLREQLPNSEFIKLYISAHSGFENDGSIILPKRDVRFCRRTLRDYFYRNSSFVNTCELWTKVIKDELLYVTPYSSKTDVRIDTTFPYEVGMFKDELIKIFSEIGENDIWYERALYLKNILSQFASYDKNDLPDTSLITEFCGGGKFNYEQ